MRFSNQTRLALYIAKYSLHLKKRLKRLLNIKIFLRENKLRRELGLQMAIAKNLIGNNGADAMIEYSEIYGERFRCVWAQCSQLTRFMLLIPGTDIDELAFELAQRLRQNNIKNTSF